MSTKTLHVAAAIIIDGSRVLAAQRNYGPMAGGWEFPGGKLEPGETGWEACVREIEEELEVTVGDGSHFMTVEHDYPDFHLSMECFTCKIVSGTLHLHAHSHLKWVPLDGLGAVRWLPADVAVAKKLGRSRA